MERRNSKEWIKELEVAVINNDINKLIKLADREIPNFSSIKEANFALHFVTKAKEIIKNDQTRIGQILEQKKKVEEYTLNMQKQKHSFHSWNS